MINPDRYTILGKYAMGITTGQIPATPLANDSHMLHLRWADSTGAFMGIRRIMAGCVMDGAVFGSATLALRLAGYRATGWTQNASTNNTNLAPGTGCLRTPSINLATMNVSLVAANQFQVCTTAGMSLATLTLDSQPLVLLHVAAPNGSSVAPLTWVPLVEAPGGEDYHSIYGQNTGFVIKTQAAFPATGVTRFFFNVTWDELTSI